MKLQDILKLTEGGGASTTAATAVKAGTVSLTGGTGTSDGAVAKYDAVVRDKKLKKNSFGKYSTEEDREGNSRECPGCATITAKGFRSVGMAPNRSKELVCQMCGKKHTNNSSKGE